ncbi:hypothetical protein HHI36_005077, partial [Cryptolaemus montrouzieri]
MPGSKTCLYANDTSILSIDSITEETSKKAEQSLRYAQRWFIVNGLKLNLSKTLSMRFGTGAEESDPIQILTRTHKYHL